MRTAFMGLKDHLLQLAVLTVLAALIAAGYAGYLDDLKRVLDASRLTFTVGQVSISVWTALRAVVAIVFLFWIASVVVSIGERRIRSLSRLKTSSRALVAKAFQIAVYFVLFLILLDVLGIDLTALAVLGGGLGIGIGFGLQKIAANFVSGIILLFERSVEEGDLIELNDGVFGFVRSTGARYTLVETFDSREVMIPNEDFITSRVVNWTYTSEQGRIEVPIGVSYGSDIEKARELMLAAARDHPRCSNAPAPQCYLREFGDSSVNFLLFFWVDDIKEGRYEPQSDVMRAIWKSFRDNDITIPFPQRDIHMIPPAGANDGRHGRE